MKLLKRKKARAVNSYLKVLLGNFGYMLHLIGAKLRLFT